MRPDGNETQTGDVNAVPLCVCFSSPHTQRDLSALYSYRLCSSAEKIRRYAHVTLAVCSVFTSLFSPHITKLQYCN